MVAASFPAPAPTTQPAPTTIVATNTTDPTEHNRATTPRATGPASADQPQQPTNNGLMQTTHPRTDDAGGELRSHRGTQERASPEERAPPHEDDSSGAGR